MRAVAVGVLITLDVVSTARALGVSGGRFFDGLTVAVAAAGRTPPP